MKAPIQYNLFVNGQSGYHTYRIPALAVTLNGTILAFCEGRKESMSDSGEISLLLRRSTDNGDTFSDIQVVATETGMTCGNPAPIVDRDTGTIWMLFNKNLADGPEELILQGKAPRTVWVTCSEDDGISWSTPEDITSDVKLPTWTWYATGPGHGIQLHSSRMALACDHNNLEDGEGFSHCVYSDDHGSTWHIGGTTDSGANESTILETTDGGLYLNCRNYSTYSGPLYRAVAWSSDGGETFSPLVRDAALPEPICQASVCRYSSAETGDRVLFSNPGYTKGEHDRRELTIRLSYDECRTWPVSRILNEGPSAYSDICVLKDGIICCLYECGVEHAYEQLTFARFTIDWLELC